MKISSRITPEGTKDILFEQCEARRQAERRISTLFRERGFREVMTPGLEFYDVFHSNSMYFPQETMYKLTDSKGRLLVMRPDCTIPIARLTSTRLDALPRPIRLYYDQPVYRANPVMKGSSDEVMQMGVELIGADTYRADLEVLELAARCLERCGLAGFRLEICHIGFFKYLMEKLDAEESVKEEIRSLIEAKNYAALGDILAAFPPSREVDALRRMPRLFGSQDVLAEASGLFTDPQPRKLLADLSGIYSKLKELGLGDRVLVDLGLVNQAEYYTGIIFRGYVEGIGEPVISGGRYDCLMEDFGQNQPATGFAVNVDLVAKAVLDSCGMAVEPPSCLVHAMTSGDTAQALLETERLSQAGICCENSVFSNLEEAIAYAGKRGIPKVRVVEEKGIREIPAEGGVNQ